MAQDRFGLSERRACRVVAQPRSTQRPPAPTPGDGPLRARLHHIPRQHQRFAYRRAHAVLVREGWILNRKKVLRLWREEGLKVHPRHHKRRRPAGGEQVQRAERPNHVWAIDFQFDATSDGRMLKLANVVDEFTREALSTRTARSCTAETLIEVLEHLVVEREAPAYLRCDNGPELIAWALRDWCRSAGMATSYIEPGSPWQNPFVESFGGKVRDEVLAVEAFDSLLEAKTVIEDWRNTYNTVRPHSSLGWKTPAAYAAGWRS
jgi:putative transposase